MLRPGWTRAEVVVVLLIVVLVVGLFLAAVARVRSEAASLTCKNNLKQLGLAAQNYYDSNNRLPPLTDQGEGALTGKGLPSVFAVLTPFIEADPWNYHSGRLATEYHAPSSVAFTFQAKGETITEHGGIVNQHRRVFLCPAESTASQLRDVPMTLPDGSTGHYATGSYAANGLAPWGSGNLTRSFPTGTAATILFAERPQVCRTGAGETVYNLWGLGFYSPHMPAFAALTPADPPGLVSTGQVAPATPLSDEGAADRDDQIRVRIGRRDAAPQTPDFPTPIQIVRDGRPCDPRLPGAPHSAGLHAVMADGSVRVFGRDTSPWVFWAACVAPASASNR